METRNLVIGLLVVGGGFFYFLHTRGPDVQDSDTSELLEPKGAETHHQATAASGATVAHPRGHQNLAPPGTFFMLTYASVPTNTGVIGFAPGQKVHLVRADPARQAVVVTDGKYEVEVQPRQLTNDIDIADLAGKGDQDSQRQIAAYVERTQAIYDQAKIAADIRYAKEIERLNPSTKPSPAK